MVWPNLATTLPSTEGVGYARRKDGRTLSASGRGARQRQTCLRYVLLPAWARSDGATPNCLSRPPTTRCVTKASCSLPLLLLKTVPRAQYAAHCSALDMHHAYDCPCFDFRGESQRDKSWNIVLLFALATPLGACGRKLCTSDHASARRLRRLASAPRAAGKSWSPTWWQCKRNRLGWRGRAHARA